MSDSKRHSTVQTSVANPDGEGSSPAVSSPSERDSAHEPIADQIEEQKKGPFAYFRTKEFYICLLLGQFLAITNTGTTTFNQLLANQGTSIPAFQSFFNYCLLNLVFTSYTIYRYGIKGWFQMLWKRWWKYVILSFCDVEGNYFMVLAYEYTTMMSAQLINFWAIVIVVVVSFLLLRVRYHVSQIVGILVCIGGMGVLIASDHIQGTNGGDVPRGDQIKGDMFALLGATFYGLANTGEEYFVSTAPVYEVIGQMGFFGMIINGVQAAIFDRRDIQHAHWNGKVGGYLTGYTLCLSIFYSTAPLLFRLASAAFFNISLLTMNFWGVIIGIEVFKYTVHWMYPIAFVLIIIGQLIYYLGRRVLGEARKPWLGQNQERGVAGIFTAKRKIEANAAAVRSAPAGEESSSDPQGSSANRSNPV
ncbi:hypothetical protein BJX61DRAFT_157432 [Aspergillus egyptiacus]|nr:hypothetical protein BJX61DRAFT_157432 [Aspergillus egyptiacus]